MTGHLITKLPTLTYLNSSNVFIYQRDDQLVKTPDAWPPFRFSSINPIPLQVVT